MIYSGPTVLPSPVSTPPCTCVERFIPAPVCSPVEVREPSIVISPLIVRVDGSTVIFGLFTVIEEGATMLIVPSSISSI